MQEPYPVRASCKLDGKAVDKPGEQGVAARGNDVGEQVGAKLHIAGAHGLQGQVMEPGEVRGVAGVKVRLEEDFGEVVPLGPEDRIEAVGEFVGLAGAAIDLARRLVLAPERPTLGRTGFQTPGTWTL